MHINNIIQNVLTNLSFTLIRTRVTHVFLDLGNDNSHDAILFPRADRWSIFPLTPHK